MNSSTTEAARTGDALGARLEEIRGRIAQCARRAGRTPEDVTLIAVSKTHAADAVRRALGAGVADFGENRVQEAEEKIENVGRTGADDAHVPRWHLIGHLQSNKARRAVKLFDVIHTVDSAELIERLERMCVEEGRAELPVLIQVDLAGEETKAGARPDALPELVAKAATCKHTRLAGLMTLPPFYEETERVRPFFRRLRELRDELGGRGAFGEARRGELSMGMSHDFEVAIEEGATMVRVGTAIFGQRAAR
ncbi:MAG TPA: YggS family pyridoxal phosphate-dependent enzyme [Pyrinomonadaceae bacterium]|nr:YggS family pyridoxal phosphate-dependent enzyme [Pyrinomonadaceae bacterium]